MKQTFTKIMLLVCLALLIGVKVLTLISSSEALFTDTFAQKAASENIQLQQSAANKSNKHIHSVAEKHDLVQVVLFGDDKADKITLKKEFKVRLKNIFASFASSAYASRILTFFKSYATHLAATVHHAPLFVLDRAIVI